MSEIQAQECCAYPTQSSTCSSVASQYTDVSVPIKMQPYTVVGELGTECCGEPVVTVRSSQGSNCSCGCELVITQTICIRIPLEYGTHANIGETSCVCKKNANCGGSGYR